MSLIPNTTIDEVRERADITEVVSEHLRIKKSGQNYKGLCPFHPEKTPSFTVSPSKQIFHCFGCGVGGNVFKFLMLTESLTFVEAVKKLAFRYGISIPETGFTRNESLRFGERDFLLHLNRKALEYFQYQLHEASQGQIARKYLESRSFGEDIQKTYQLGYAPAAWRELSTHFQNQKGCSIGQLEKAGLVKRKEGRSSQDPDIWYDRFRGRIIFPLHDAQGNPVGFAGRLISESDQKPKYLNSPETLLYKKSNQLFGFHFARDFIRKENEVLIVEGYFDQMRLHQHGISHAVATCGTALTPKQVALLNNHTQKAVLIFDSDPAGQSATQRGIELLLERGMQVRVLSLPPGEDPDSFLLKQGEKGFREKLKTAPAFLEYMIHKSKEEEPVKTTAQRVEIINTVLPILMKISNEVERREGFDLLVYELNIEDKDLLTELKKAYEKNKTFLRPSESKANYHQSPEEHYLILLMLSGNAIAETIRREVPLEAFSDATYTELAGIFYAQLDRGEPIRADRVMDHLENNEAKKMLSQLSMIEQQFDDPEKAAADCTKKIKIRRLEEQINNIKKERNDAIKAGEEERSRRLQQRVREMQSSLNQVAHTAG